MRRFVLAVACMLVTVVPGLAQTLHIALRQDLDVMDPTLATTYVGRIVFAGLCDKLFDIDEKLNIVPQLATGYEWADDKTLVIHLRPGVKFQDGEAMDAGAVKYTFDRYLTMQGSFRKSEISSIDQVEIVDPATVRVVLKSPSGAFLAQLTDRSGMILPPKVAEQEGKDFASHPVCSGPFKFVERVPQDHVTLERFADYWDAKTIHFDRVVYQVFLDSSVRLANLKAGSSDITEYIAPTDADAVKADPKLRLVVSDALGYTGLTNNLDNGARSNNPYGKNPLVRQAFNAAIDRAALVQVVYNGMYAPSVQPVSASSPFYDPSLKPPPRDVAKAKALLQQAGVTLPVKIELLTPNQPDVLQSRRGDPVDGRRSRLRRPHPGNGIRLILAGVAARRLRGLSHRLVRACRRRRQYVPVPAFGTGQQRQPLQQSNRRQDAAGREGPDGCRQAPHRLLSSMVRTAARFADHVSL